MTGKSPSRPHCSEPITKTSNALGGCRRDLLVVAEGLHVLNQRVYAAILEQDTAALVTLARQHLAGGAQALAVNLGPGRAMAKLTTWVTETLRRELDAPLFLSAGGLAFPELLRTHGHTLTINAVTADPATLPHALTVASACGCALVVLLARPGFTPTGSADRMMLAAEVLDLAEQHGFPRHRLYLDPLLTQRPDPVAWRVSRGMPDLGAVAETISQLRLVDEDLRTIVALGNCANSGDRRPGLQARVLTVLVEAGLDAVLLNTLDPLLLHACRESFRGKVAQGEICRAA